MLSPLWPDGHSGMVKIGRGEGRCSPPNEVFLPEKKRPHITGDLRSALALLGDLRRRSLLTVQMQSF